MMNSYELERKHLLKLYEIVTMMADSNGAAHLGETIRDLNRVPLTLQKDNAFVLSFMSQWDGLMHIKKFIEKIKSVESVSIMTGEIAISMHGGTILHREYDVEKSDGRAELLSMFAQFARIYNMSINRTVVYYSDIATAVKA